MVFVEDAFSAFVVGSNHCGRLVVSKFDECLSDGAGILCIHEGGCHFGLCCGGHDWADEGAQHVDWSIHWWALARREFGWICAEEVVAAGSGFGLAVGSQW